MSLKFRSCLFLRFKSFFKNKLIFFVFFCFKLIFFMFLDHFDALMSKIIFKKHYFDTFSSKKYFKKQPQPHFQISS